MDGPSLAALDDVPSRTNKISHDVSSSVPMTSISDLIYGRSSFNYCNLFPVATWTCSRPTCTTATPTKRSMPAPLRARKNEIRVA